MTLAPGTPIGRYFVCRKLAEGGMAELYLCSSRGPEGFEKEIVIKRLRPFLSSDPEFVRMFITEARLASRLNHPNVVQIFDFDKHEDAYYLAMEHVRGHSLSEVRKRCKARMIAMPPTLVAHVGAEVAKGLHHAHRLTENGRRVGLVHRDVSPHNVLLSFDGAVKLTDFGIAKASNKLTSPGRLKGKLAYMSPEQSRGEPVDARTDVFALGIVLWEMLTGGRLFDGDSDMAVLQSVRSSAIPTAARLNPDVPLELDAAVMKALERKPDARHQTAQEFERALAQCVLRHARTLDDTDVAGFIRMLFAEECSSRLNENRERSPPREGVVATGPTHRPRGSSAQPGPPDAVAGIRSRLARRVGLKLRLATVGLVLLAGVLAARAVWLQRAGPGAVVTEASSAAAQSVDSPKNESTPAESPEASASSPTYSRSGSGFLEPAPEVVQGGLGTLILKIAPWAFLAIDGRSKGEVSGVRRFPVKAGKHHLQLWHPRGSKEVEIFVPEGGRVVEEYRVFGRRH